MNHGPLSPAVAKALLLLQDRIAAANLPSSKSVGESSGLGPVGLTWAGHARAVLGGRVWRDDAQERRRHAGRGALGGGRSRWRAHVGPAVAPTATRASYAASPSALRRRAVLFQ